jgi:ribosomal protein L16/L10AE
MKLYTIWKAGSERRLNQRQSCAQGSFGLVAERETDLRRKRLSSSRQIVIKSIVNMKGMNVILRRLRPVPINR